MPRPCPRCAADVSGPLCPACGLDLEVFSELRALREELSALRAALGATPPPPVAAPVPAATPAEAAAPPPLPPLLTVPPPLPTQGTAHEGPTPGRGFSEIAVGQRWFLVLGVIAILFGAGFFLKYAFEERWIGPAVQVTLGFVAGCLALGGGYLLRRANWRGLDGGVAALGLGLLYLSAYAGSQVYELLPDYLTLVVALIVAALGAAIAASWDSLALASLTFLGGYLAPMLLVAERFGHWLFFLYVAVLNAASQLLAYARRWRFLYAFGATLSWLALLVWGLNHDGRERFAETFTFTQFLFFLYSVAPFARALVRADEERAQGFWVSMVNGLLCVWNSDYLLDGQRLPVSCVAATYAALTLGLLLRFWRAGRPSVAATWLIAEGCIYLLTTWAVALPGGWITTFWAAQTVALYAVAARGRDRVLCVGAIVLGALVCARLAFVDAEAWWGEARGPTPFTAGLAQRWAVDGVSLVCLLLVAVWDRQRPAPGLERWAYPWFEGLTVVLLFTVVNLEGARVTAQCFPRAAALSSSLLWAGFGAGLLGYGFYAQRKRYRLLAIALLFLTAAKVLLLDTAQISTPYRILSCVLLGGTLVVLSAMYYRLGDRLARGGTE